MIIFAHVFGLTACDFCFGAHRGIAKALGAGKPVRVLAGGSGIFRRARKAKTTTHLYWKIDDVTEQEIAGGGAACLRCGLARKDPARLINLPHLSLVKCHLSHKTVFFWRSLAALGRVIRLLGEA